MLKRQIGSMQGGFAGERKELAMYRNGSFMGVGAALGCLLLGVAGAVALLGESGVTASVGVSAAQNARDALLHHLSGVVAIPPRQVQAEAAARERGGNLILNPPLFGPNVDATLNNPAAQNETTIAINPEDGQRIIASANDYRANLQPWVYLS